MLQVPVIVCRTKGAEGIVVNTRSCSAEWRRKSFADSEDGDGLARIANEKKAAIAGYVPR
ncbi:hypothetical protein MTX20_21630 [Bradyrhizobium sp. ISRA435]|nr:hypothetical protein MTX20_21630 [Bradyrhizobium sp. ISRA435]